MWKVAVTHQVIHDRVINCLEMITSLSLTARDHLDATPLLSTVLQDWKRLSHQIMSTHLHLGSPGLLVSSIFPWWMILVNKLPCRLTDDQNVLIKGIVCDFSIISLEQIVLNICQKTYCQNNPEHSMQKDASFYFSNVDCDDAIIELGLLWNLKDCLDLWLEMHFCKIISICVGISR